MDDTFEQSFDFETYLPGVVQVFVQPDEGHHHSVGLVGQSLVQGLFVEAVCFANLTLGAIPFDGSFEMAFGDADKYACRCFIVALGEHVHRAQGEGGDGFSFTFEKFPDDELLVLTLGFAQCGRSYGHG